MMELIDMAYANTRCSSFVSATVGLSSILHAGRFDVAEVDKSEGRGELESTDVNNEYIRQGATGYRVLDGCLNDAGTFESLLRAGVFSFKKRRRELQH